MAFQSAAVSAVTLQDLLLPRAPVTRLVERLGALSAAMELKDSSAHVRAEVESLAVVISVSVCNALASVSLVSVVSLITQ